MKKIGGGGGGGQIRCITEDLQVANAQLIDAVASRLSTCQSNLSVQSRLQDGHLVLVPSLPFLRHVTST